MSIFLEIIIFVSIALVLITALINMLGKIDEDDITKAKSFFGERPDLVHEIYDTESGGNLIATNSMKNNIEQFKEIIHADNHLDKLKIIKDLCQLITKMPTFKPLGFISSASKAMLMIVEAFKKNDTEVLEYLMDKRLLENLSSQQHQSLTSNEEKIKTAKISEVYQFGQSIFIKVLFELSDNILEEWTFARRLNGENIWQVNNISSKK